MEFRHTPVMAREVVEYLGCRDRATYVDGTLGGGGHTIEILKASGPTGRVIGIDRDKAAIEAASKALAEYGGRVVLVRGNFRDLPTILAGLNAGPVDGIVLDLGVSSYQLDSPERGFSFRFDSPLDMRMDSGAALTARDLVNTLDARELTRIFREYGEEREAGRIARAIVRAREAAPVETTGDLVRIIEETIPKRFQPKNIHPATRVFQALRIAVNDELESVEQGIKGGIESLEKGGRMVVISFHSLEDRIVKNAFRESSTGCVCPPRVPICVCGKVPVTRVLTKKAVIPSDEEAAKNPRSRSAKLRAVEKL